MIFTKKKLFIIFSLILFPIVTFTLIFNLYTKVTPSTESTDVKNTDKVTSVVEKVISKYTAATSIKEENKIIKNAKGLSKEVLHLALKAYHNAYNDDEIKNNKLTIIDYSLPSNAKRMWVIDMDKKLVDINTYVSHGVRSGEKNSTSFSNKKESHQSSIGVMKTGAIYHGKRGMSLHLHGLEDNVNSNVYQRHVVIHGASYVSDNIAKNRGQIGRSFGCPAVDNKIAKPLIKKIANGSLVFAYYPLKSWLNSSEYLI